MTDAPLPDLILYGRADCGLCTEARGMLDALLADRRDRGLAIPRLVERDIDTDPAWQRDFFAVVPVVELGERRLETVTSLAKLRRLLSEQLDAPRDDDR
ncbi:MAG: glutaredoxin family protein [Candidatus Limnocylindrales bacterium]